ncbi:hypothetical protein D3C87_466310 [compost metagenome]
MTTQKKPIIIVSVDATRTQTAIIALKPQIGEGYLVPALDAQTNTVDTLIYPYNEPIATHYLADVLESAGLKYGSFKIVIHHVPFEVAEGPI